MLSKVIYFSRQDFRENLAKKNRISRPSHLHLRNGEWLTPTYRRLSTDQAHALSLRLVIVQMFDHCLLALTTLVLNNLHCFQGKGGTQGGLFEVKPWTRPIWHYSTTVATPKNMSAEVNTSLRAATK